MSTLKLKDAGDEATVTIASIAIKAGDFGDSVEFTTDAGDTVFVPKSSVERQLDRIGVETIDDIPGRTIRFSRAANTKKPGAKPFWNLDHAVAKPANGKPPIASALPPKPAKQVPDVDDGYMESLTGNDDATTETSGFDTLKSRYKECVDFASVAWGKDTSDVALVAAAATLFIARNQQRV